jgi:hypothetical protein
VLDFSVSSYSQFVTPASGTCGSSYAAYSSARGGWEAVIHAPIYFCGYYNTIAIYINIGNASVTSLHVQGAQSGIRDDGYPASARFIIHNGNYIFDPHYGSGSYQSQYDGVYSGGSITVFNSTYADPRPSPNNVITKLVVEGTGTDPFGLDNCDEPTPSPTPSPIGTPAPTRTPNPLGYPDASFTASYMGSDEDGDYWGFEYTGGSDLSAYSWDFGDCVGEDPPVCTNACFQGENACQIISDGTLVSGRWLKVDPPLTSHLYEDEGTYLATLCVTSRITGQTQCSSESITVPFGGPTPTPTGTSIPPPTPLPTNPPPNTGDETDDIITEYGDNFGQILASLFDWLGGFWDLLSGLGDIVSGLFSAIQGAFDFIVDLLGFLALLFQLIVGLINVLLVYIGQIIERLVGLVTAFFSAPATPIPGAPACDTNPSASDLCAVYYILRWTILAPDTPGQYIMPLVTAILNVAIILRFSQLVMRIVNRGEDVTRT